MIRRAATRIPDSAPGFIIEGLVKRDVDENQTFVWVFEASGPGTFSEEKLTDIKPTDGSPIEIAVI